MRKSDKVFVSTSLERANALRRKGAWRRAIAAYEELLSEHPDRADVRLKLADLYAAHGKPTAAVAHYMATADAFAKQGFKERAVGVYLAAARRVPLEPEPYRRAARLELERGHRGNGVRLLLASARVFSRSARHGEALVLLRQAFSLEPFQLDTSLFLARTLARTGHKAEARSLLVRLAWEKHGRALVRVRWALLCCVPTMQNAIGFVDAAMR